MAAWLKEVAARPQRSTYVADNASDVESILQYLEERLGTRIRSEQDVDAFLHHLAESRLREAGHLHSRRIIRETVLLSLLALSFLHYYFWDVHLQIAALKSIPVFAQPVPAKGDGRDHPSPAQTRT